MKQSKKQNENRSQQKPLRKFARRPKDLDRMAPLLHEVIIKLDAHAAKNLFLSPLGIDGLSLGPEETSLVLRATVTFPELLTIASWAYSMGTHVSVRSPWFFRETAKLNLPAPGLVGLSSFAA